MFWLRGCSMVPLQRHEITTHAFFPITNMSNPRKLWWAFCGPQSSRPTQCSATWVHTWVQPNFGPKWCNTFQTCMFHKLGINFDAINVLWSWKRKHPKKTNKSVATATTTTHVTNHVDISDICAQLGYGDNMAKPFPSSVERSKTSNWHAHGPLKIQEVLAKSLWLMLDVHLQKEFRPLRRLLCRHEMTAMPRNASKQPKPSNAGSTKSRQGYVAKLSKRSA